MSLTARQTDSGKEKLKGKAYRRTDQAFSLYVSDHEQRKTPSKSATVHSDGSPLTAGVGEADILSCTDLPRDSQVKRNNDHEQLRSSERRPHTNTDAWMPTQILAMGNSRCRRHFFLGAIGAFGLVARTFRLIQTGVIYHVKHFLRNNCFLWRRRSSFSTSKPHFDFESHPHHIVFGNISRD